jgi:hypothetical protein
MGSSLEQQLASGRRPGEVQAVNYTGTVKNGVVVLPSDAKLREGATVKVEALEVDPKDDAFLAAALKVAKLRPHWASDYALNHGHYVSGEPKKC